MYRLARIKNSIKRIGKRRLTLVTAAVAGIATLSGGAVVAASYLATSGPTDRNLHYSIDTPFSAISNTDWSTVPGTQLSFVVPDGERRLFDVRFTGESKCNGPVSSWCSVRIVYQRISGAPGPVTEMYPAAGTDFAFDTPIPGTTTHYAGHAMERNSIVLPAGTYQISVQAQRVLGATEFRLDDMNLTIAMNKP